MSWGRVDVEFLAQYHFFFSMGAFCKQRTRSHRQLDRHSTTFPTVFCPSQNYPGVSRPMESFLLPSGFFSLLKCCNSVHFSSYEEPPRPINPFSATFFTSFPKRWPQTCFFLFRKGGPFFTRKPWGPSSWGIDHYAPHLNFESFSCWSTFPSPRCEIQFFGTTIPPPILIRCFRIDSRHPPRCISPSRILSKFAGFFPPSILLLCPPSNLPRCQVFI